MIKILQKVEKSLVFIDNKLAFMQIDINIDIDIINCKKIL